MSHSRFSSRLVIQILWKSLSVMCVCVFAAYSGFFKADQAEASYLIEKRCMQNQSKKLKQESRKKICTCVVMNLKTKLQPDQIKDLEKIYKDRSTRMAAASDERLKPLIAIDFEANKNCAQNSLWQWPTEDLGEPDPLN